MKGWKTIGASVLIAALGALEAADWTNVVGEDTGGPVMIAIAGLMAVLRALTTTPMGKPR